MQVLMNASDLVKIGDWRESRHSGRFASAAATGPVPAGVVGGAGGRRPACRFPHEGPDLHRFPSALRAHPMPTSAEIEAAIIARDIASGNHLWAIDLASCPHENAGFLDYNTYPLPHRTQIGRWWYTRDDEDVAREHPKPYWYLAEGDGVRGLPRRSAAAGGGA